MRLPALEWREAGDWPLALHITAGTVLAVAVASMWLALSWSHRQEELSAARALQTRTRTDLARARREAARLPALNADIVRLASPAAPTDGTQADLMRSLRQAAANQGLALVQLTPGPERRHGTTRSSTVDAALQGEFRTLLDFWQSLAALPPTFGCESFALATDDWPRLMLKTRLRIDGGER